MPPSRHRRLPADRRGRRRTPPVAASGGFNNRWLLVAFAAIAVVFVIALLVPVFLPLIGGGGRAGTGSADAYIPGIGRQVEVAGDVAHFPDTLDITAVVPEGYHTVDPDDPNVAIPPTSGRHWDRWASCGFYTEPVPDERIVHNMEHGNIIVSYNLTDPAAIDALKAAYEAIDLTTAWGVARPYDGIAEGAVALTTWGVVDGPMVGVDAARIERFFDAYAGKLGPEFPNGAPCTQGGVMNPAG